MAEPMVAAPIVIDLGKKKRRQIKRLKKHSGRLMDEVEAAVGRVLTTLGDDADDKQVVPVVFVYRKKNRKRKGKALCWH